MDSKRKKGSIFAGAATFVLLVPMVALVMTSTKPGRISSDSGNMILGTVKRGSFDVRVRLVGHLEAARSTTVSSEVKGDSGKIVYIVESGTQVEKGDVLVRLDPTPFEDEAKEWLSHVDACKANVIALQQALEWEKNQAVREESAIEYELEVSKMELEKVEMGDGPLELAQLQNEMRKAKED